MKTFKRLLTFSAGVVTGSVILFWIANRELERTLKTLDLEADNAMGNGEHKVTVENHLTGKHPAPPEDARKKLLRKISTFDGLCEEIADRSENALRAAAIEDEYHPSELDIIAVRDYSEMTVIRLTELFKDAGLVLCSREYLKRLQDQAEGGEYE